MKTPDIIRNIVGDGGFRENEPMKKHCTFRCGGEARYFVMPQTREQFVEVIKTLKDRKEKHVVIGRGSNILVRDEGIDAYVINTNFLGNIKTDGNIITADCGASLVGVTNEAMKNSLSGLEFACAIPGSVGGAVFMNAGAHGGEMKDVLKSVTVYDGEDISVKSPEELDLSYRHSNLEEKGWTVLSAVFSLEKADMGAVRRQMEENRAFRKSQPSEPSAGSTFKRGNGFITAKLIDDAGLKGKRIGGAAVSEKHAGFIVNLGEATSTDVIKLIDYVRKEVYNKYEVEIEEEIRIL